jgi:TM2 domain-containing membrane protein YozV
MPYCPKCGGQINADSKYCFSCGATVQQPSGATATTNTTTIQTAAAPKSLSTTLLLAILLGLFGIWGIGHFYLGQNGRGVVFLIAGLAIASVGTAVGFIAGLFTFGIAAVLVWLLGLAGYIYQVVDAYNSARSLGAR